MTLEASKGPVTQKGTTWIKTRNVPIAKPCVYCLNAREDFATFLGSSEIPPCMNKVERAFRGFTILRKNSPHKHSANYMEAMCMALSIDATLREHGIDPFKWLQKYDQALFKHMTVKGLSLRSGRKPVRGKPNSLSGSRKSWMRQIRRSINIFLKNLLKLRYAALVRLCLPAVSSKLNSLLK